MESKVRGNSRLTDANDVVLLKSKTTRKLLWDSLCEVYEKEKDVKPRVIELNLADSSQRNVKEYLNSFNAEVIPEKLTEDKSKMGKKNTSRRLRRLSDNGPNEADTSKKQCEKSKTKRKLRKLERQNGSKCLEFKNTWNENENIDPSQVIVLHQRRAKVSRKSHKKNAEPGNERLNSRKLHDKERSINANISEEKDFQEKRPCTIDHIKGDSLNQKEITGQDALHIKNKQLINDKIKKRRSKGVVYKTLSNHLEPKTKKKRQKVLNEQVLNEATKSAGVTEGVLEKIRNLPIKVDENQLIFMAPSHISKILEYYNAPSKNKNVRKYNDTRGSKKEITQLNNGTYSKVSAEASTSKTGLENKVYPKKLPTSTKNILLEDSGSFQAEGWSNNCNSNNSIKKERREKRKRKSKYSTSVKKSCTSAFVRSRKSLRGYQNINSNYNEPLREETPIGFGQNLHCGDGKDEIRMSYVSSRNNKLPTIYSESILEPTSITTDVPGDGNSCTTNPSQDKTNSDEMQQSSGNINKDYYNPKRTTVSLAKPSISKDKKRLAFQLIKTDINPKHLKRVRKGVYGMRNRHMTKSKEKFNLSQQEDKLMLFYANKESSSTSKESLSIAICRDTEISNNGSSNNVLNVVITQTKNSTSSTKTHCSIATIDKREHEIREHEIREHEIREHEIREHEIREHEISNTKECAGAEEVLGFMVTGSEERSEVAFKEVGCQTNNLSTKVKLPGSFLTDSKVYQMVREHENSSQSNKYTNLNRNPKPMINNYQSISSNCNSMKKDGFNSFKTKNANCTESTDFLNKDLKYENTEKSLKDDDKKRYFFRVVNDESDKDSNKEELIRPIAATVRKELPLVTPEFVTKQKLMFETVEKPTLKKCKSVDKVPKVNKTEPENLELKLRQIGLSSKKSFVKIIESDDKLSTSLKQNNDIDSCKISENEDVAKAKVESTYHKTSDAEKKKILHSMQIKALEQQLNDYRDNLSNVIKQNISMNLQVSEQNNESLLEKINYQQREEKVTTCKSVTEKNSDRENVLQECCKTNKEGFLVILPNSKTEIGKGDSIKENLTAPVNSEDEKRHSLAMDRMAKKFIVSEIGVQTDLPDPSEQNRKTNIVGSVEGEKTHFCTEIKIPPDSCIQKPNVIKTINVAIVDNLVPSGKDQTKNSPTRRKSFVQIINTCKNDCNNDFKLENQESSLSDENTLKKDSTEDKTDHKFKPTEETQFLVGTKNEKHQNERQIVYKINAIYEFLKYLDNIIKDNTLMKPSGNCKARYELGLFNNTLKCLCSNCLEILDKMESNANLNRKNINPTKKQEDSCKTLLQYKDFLGQNELQKGPEKVSQNNITNLCNNNSSFVHVVSEINSESKREIKCSQSITYLNLDEIEKRGINSPYQNKLSCETSCKPFFVIVPSKESINGSELQKANGGLEKLKNSHEEQLKPFKTEFNSHELKLDLEDPIGSALLERKIKGFKAQENKNKLDQSKTSNYIHQNKAFNGVKLSAFQFVMQNENKPNDTRLSGRMFSGGHTNCEKNSFVQEKNKCDYSNIQDLKSDNLYDKILLNNSICVKPNNVFNRLTVFENDVESMNSNWYEGKSDLQLLGKSRISRKDSFENNLIETMKNDGIVLKCRENDDHITSNNIKPFQLVYKKRNPVEIESVDNWDCNKHIDEIEQPSLLQDLSSNKIINPNEKNQQGMSQKIQIKRKNSLIPSSYVVDNSLERKEQKHLSFVSEDKTPKHMYVNYDLPKSRVCRRIISSGYKLDNGIQNVENGSFLNKNIEYEHFLNKADLCRQQANLFVKGNCFEKKKSNVSCVKVVKNSSNYKKNETNPLHLESDDSANDSHIYLEYDDDTDSFSERNCSPKRRDCMNKKRAKSNASLLDDAKFQKLHESRSKRLSAKAERNTYSTKSTTSIWDSSFLRKITSHTLNSTRVSNKTSHTDDTTNNLNHDSITRKHSKKAVRRSALPVYSPRKNYSISSIGSFSSNFTSSLVFHNSNFSEVKKNLVGHHEKVLPARNIHKQGTARLGACDNPTEEDMMNVCDKVGWIPLKTDEAESKTEGEKDIKISCGAGDDEIHIKLVYLPQHFDLNST